MRSSLVAIAVLVSLSAFASGKGKTAVLPTRLEGSYALAQTKSGECPDRLSIRVVSARKMNECETGYSCEDVELGAQKYDDGSYSGMRFKKTATTHGLQIREVEHRKTNCMLLCGLKGTGTRTWTLSEDGDSLSYSNSVDGDGSIFRQPAVCEYRRI